MIMTEAERGASELIQNTDLVQLTYYSIHIFHHVFDDLSISAYSSGMSGLGTGRKL